MPTPSGLTAYEFQGTAQQLTLIGTPAESVPWVEYVDDESPVQMHLSRLQNSQSVMTYMTAAKNWYVSATREKLLTTILGGYFHLGGESPGAGISTLRHQPPLRHPYSEGMWATEILGVTFKKYQAEVTKQDNGGQLPFAAYDVAFITINFQTLPFTLKLVPDEGYNPNWVSIESVSSNTYTNAPVGLYRYTEGAFVTTPANRGVWVRKAEAKINMVIHSVYQDLIFIGPGAPWASLKMTTPTVTVGSNTIADSPCGFVNQQSFLNKEPETLLLNSIDLLPIGDVNGYGRYYNMRLELLYNAWGWNRILDPTGTPNRVVSIFSGLPPYSPISFDELFQAFNPTSSFVAPPS